MGEPKRSRRKYERPARPWDTERIKEEDELVRKYGLKNKKELWKAEALLRNFRRQSRTLHARLRYKDVQAEREAKLLLARLAKLGLVDENASLDDILSLNVESILGRRLQTLVYLKGLAHSPKQARQFIVHGHTVIGKRVVTIPSYIVKRDEEQLINYNPQSVIADELHPARPKKEFVERLAAMRLSQKSAEQ
jgi:small subunit ribosomal protein S4